MKTTLLFCLMLSAFGFSQKKKNKDYTEQQLLKNSKVIDFSKAMETTNSNTINFLKCLKKESGINTYKKLPFFTEKLPLIVDKKIERHNYELWEVIFTECKQKTIFNKN